MINDATPDNGVGPAPGGHGRDTKKAAALIGLVTAVIGLVTAVVTLNGTLGENDSPRLAITAPVPGPGATAPACSLVRGTATLADGTTLLVAVRRTSGLPRTRTTSFYRVDTVRPSGQWDVSVSLEGNNPKMGGQWYSITVLTVQTPWTDFLERVDGIADEPFMTASAMPPHEGETASVEVQREAGQGSC